VRRASATHAVHLVSVEGDYPPGMDRASLSDPPGVLFVCVHNAGRSQMAAALLDRHAAGRVRVRSAGSEPADRLNPAVVHAMAEIGIDLTAERPKLLREEDVRDADVVITMGCGDACPVFPGISYEDWELTDPSGRSLTEVRVIRDEIDRRVRRLLGALTGQAASAARSEASGSDRTR
jgi:arsenate reductase (thioredoxin)